MTVNPAGESSAMPLKRAWGAGTNSHSPLLLVIPSFATNSEVLLRLSNKAGYGRSVATNMKTSKLEDETFRQIVSAGLPEPEREYQFLPNRKFRFDFAWPRLKVAVEVQGGIWSVGAHSTGSGITRDYTKNNLAQADGWTVFFVTSDDIKNKTVVPLLRSVL